MNRLTTLLTAALKPYRLRLDDMELVRAQFREFVHQIPLLYFILASSAAAVAATCRDIDSPVLTRLVPGVLCLVATLRGVWWWRRKFAAFTDVQIRRHLTTTDWLAKALAAGFVGWIMLLYPHGDAYARGHMMFFFAVTQLACVFCLMPVRSAALGVATIGAAPFALYFELVDGGRMWGEAINFTLVAAGMIAILFRYHASFAALIASQRDLRARQLEAELLSEENRRVALTDALSGLPNRRALIARLEYVAGEAAIMFIDLDGFKKVNDDHGHQLGDALIRRIGADLADLAPADSMPARMGGDEFALLVEGAAAGPRALALAQQLLDRLRHPVAVEGRLFQVGASIGVATDDTGMLDAYELVRRADAAMYRVKEGGRSGVLLYDASLEAGRIERQRIEAEIRRGIGAGEFDVAYQPLVTARGGEIVAVEALVRWPGRPAGPLGPDAFIAIAEASGLIQPLGLFVLERACTELRDRPNLRLHVNISPAQLRSVGFEGDVARVLAVTGFPPERLQMEITEGYLIDHPERARRAISHFQAMGVSVALDDFGKGHASIGTLRRFGFSGVKIDRSLAQALGSDANAALLVTGMVHLANGLEMRVTAEGVETETQAELLRLAGCHELQGYLFGRPAPLADLLDRLGGEGRRAG